MGRHGDCLRLAEAAKRKDVLKDVASPQDFTAQMRRQGKPVKTTDLPGGAVLLEAAGLSLVFVPAKSCPAP
ncbi:MAG: hypothetical protein O3A85_06980 [Proteobacteria bacterium]|nr:hypothetical protein [Pseudomonadota bacterium]